jgi:hypothetical protein
MEENEENKNCECTNCKCKTLSKAKDMLEQKRKAVSGGEVVQKDLQNGINIEIDPFLKP